MWVGYGWLDAVHRLDRAYVERQWREALATGQNLDAEYRLGYAKGGYRWTHARAIPVWNAEWLLLRWVSINLEIGERKSDEEALQKNLTLLQQSEEVAPMGSSGLPH